MLKYLLRRLTTLLPVLLLVSFLSFSLIYLVPGDPAAAILGDSVGNTELYNKLRAELGLDRPFLMQYLDWLGGLLKGQLGVSIVAGQSIAEQILESLGPSLMLTVTSMTVAISIGISLGLLAGSSLGTRLDAFLSSVAVVGFSVPGFLVGIMLLYVFTVMWPVLPSGGYVPFTEDPLGCLRSLVLPSLALGSALSAVLMRQMRGSMAKTMHQDFILVAKAKGLPHRTIIVGHALKNSLIPVITIIGLQIGNVIGGVAVIETIFSLPGMGHLAVDSIMSRNYPMLQAVILLTAVAVMLINLAVDLLYAVVDPRIRYE